MQSSAQTVEEYIAEIHAERREAFAQLVSEIRNSLDPKFEEQMSYGMIGWVVPKSVYPAGYHANPKLPVPYMNLGNQKNYIVLHAMCLYSNAQLLEWFQEEYAKTGFKLDMGKGCIRFKHMDRIPFELIGRLAASVTLEKYLGITRHCLVLAE